MPPEPHAITIAANLRQKWGDEAAGQARWRAARAEALGQVAQCDLYRAVCSVLADREGVVRRSRQ